MKNILGLGRRWQRSLQDRKPRRRRSPLWTGLRGGRWLGLWIGLGLAVVLAGVGGRVPPAQSQGFQSPGLQTQGFPAPAAGPTRDFALDSTSHDQAQSRFAAGDFASAAALWQILAEQAARQGDRLNAAAAWGNAALAGQQLGEWEAAQGAIAAAWGHLAAAPAGPERDRVAAELGDIQGQGQRATGDAASAAETWAQAALAHARGDRPVAAARSRLNQAQALQDLGLYPRACATLLMALGWEDPGDRPITDCHLPAGSQPPQTALPPTAVLPADLRLMALINLSNGLRMVGQWADATATLGWANQLWRERDRQDPQMERLEAALQLAVGNGHRAEFERDLVARRREWPTRSLALAAFAQATTAAERTGQTNLAIAARLSALETHLTPLGHAVRHRPDGTETAAVAALNQQIQGDLAALPLGRARVYSPVQWAQGWLRLQERAETQGHPRDRAWATLAPDPATLATVLEQAIIDSRQLGDRRALAYALGAKGALALGQGQRAIARQDTQAALELADHLAASDIAYQLLWQLGRIERAEGDRSAAIQAYQAAVTTLRQLRSDLVAVSAEVQFSFRESVEPIYRELVDLLLASEATITPTNLRQARDTIEALQLAELDNFFQDACSLAQPVAADTVDPHAALIYTITLPDRLEVIAALPGGQLHHHRISQPQATLELTLVQARAAVTKQPLQGIATDLSALQSLYDGLVRPLEPELAARGVETLVFVLDSALRNLPVAALHDGDRFLIESYGVALTPGLQLLDPQPLARQNLQTLTAGLTQARQGFEPLPGVEQELQRIGATVPTQMLLDETFTAAQFNEAVNRSPFQIVHVATHGEFSSNATDTFILTWDDRVNARDLDRLLSADVRQRQPIELLVLSACRTALGDDRAALGLAGVAVRAGARSTLASLWYVSDRATAELMARFYETLAQSTTTKAAALRTAQRSLIQTPDLNAPYYWSAFVLVGNWL